jgi:uncharacterized protein (TIGR02246 family)
MGMLNWTARGAIVLAGSLCLCAGAQAQQKKPLTEADTAAIKQLSARYATALDSCKAGDYAEVFTPDGAFISGPRGTLSGRDQLEGLVRSERHCQSTPASSTPAAAADHAVLDIAIEPTAEGATGKVRLPGKEPGTTNGHYDDVYVKTASGWRIKSRTYLSPREEPGGVPIPPRAQAPGASAK